MFFHYLSLKKLLHGNLAVGGSLTSRTVTGGECEERAAIREAPYNLLNTVRFSKIYHPNKLMRKYPSPGLSSVLQSIPPCYRP